jgi:hypothetical protein
MIQAVHGFVVAVLLIPGASSSASASPGKACDTVGGGATDGVLVESSCSSPGSEEGRKPGSPSPRSVEAPAYVEYIWNSVCMPFSPSSIKVQGPDCRAAQNCEDPVERLWELWGRRPGPDAGWALLGSECFGRPPEVPDTPRPQVTPGRVLEAIRRIGLPEVTARTQPADKTLVNFATIFYADPETFTRTIRLLGQRVEVEATPSRFTWHYGDGTSATTAGPGAPYPSKEITYKYADAHTTVNPSVDVTYTARFRVNGGAWRDIDETVTIAGPSSALRIAEAVAVLSGSYY